MQLFSVCVWRVACVFSCTVCVLLVCCLPPPPCCCGIGRTHRNGCFLALHDGHPPVFHLHLMAAAAADCHMGGPCATRNGRALVLNNVWTAALLLPAGWCPGPRGRAALSHRMRPPSCCILSPLPPRPPPPTPAFPFPPARCPRVLMYCVCGRVLRRADVFVVAACVVVWLRGRGDVVGWLGWARRSGDMLC